MIIKKGYLIVIFTLFAVIFAGALVTIALPAHTADPLGNQFVKFSIRTLIESPKYAEGLGAIALFSFAGIVFTRYAQAKIDEAEKPTTDEKTIS